MVTDYTRNNAIMLGTLSAFIILIIIYTNAFLSDSKQTSREVRHTVDVGVANVTQVMSEMVGLMKEERETNSKNLALFLNAFGNQSLTNVKAINDMRDVFTDVTENQTNKFVETLDISQNLSIQNINVTSERNKIMTALVNVLINQTAANQSFSNEYPIDGNITARLNETN